MCCLGQYGLACGLKEEDIRDINSPCQAVKHDDDPNVRVAYSPLIAFDDDGLPATNNQKCADLMQTNDNIAITEHDREELIIIYFKRLNVEVTFVD